MLYYEVRTDDTHFADRWFLDEPVSDDGTPIDAREFRYGRPYVGPLPTRIPINQPGRCVQFNFAAFDMPVVTAEIARIINDVATKDVECFPVKVGSLSTDYVILNAICCENCVDEARSEVLWWKPEDGRPDKVGRYRMVSNLTIDPTRTHDRHIFRIADYAIIMIVSEVIREALEDQPDLGVIFHPVC